MGKRSAANDKAAKKFRKLEDAMSNAKQQASIGARKLVERMAAFVRSKGKLKTTKQSVVAAASRKKRLEKQLRNVKKKAKAGTAADKKALQKAKGKVKKDL